jgi:hypothetical protein
MDDGKGVISTWKYFQICMNFCKNESCHSSGSKCDINAIDDKKEGSGISFKY